MAINLNKTFIGGNLTKDPELRFTSTGTAVCNFDIAVNRKFKQGEEWKTDVQYFKIIVWGKTGENCAKYLGKGKGALVEGRLQNRSYETSNGQKKYITEIVADSIQFTGSKGESSDSSPESVFTDAGFTAVDNDESIPF